MSHLNGGSPLVGSGFNNYFFINRFVFILSLFKYNIFEVSRALSTCYAYPSKKIKSLNVSPRHDVLN